MIKKQIVIHWLFVYALTVWHIFLMNFILLCLQGSEVKLQDIKTEPSAMFFGSPFGPVSNDSKQRLVSVAITLRPAAAEVRKV